MYSRLSKSPTSPNSTNKPQPTPRSAGSPTSPSFSLNQGLALVHSAYLTARKESSLASQVHLPTQSSSDTNLASNRTQSSSAGHNPPQNQTVSSPITNLPRPEEPLLHAFPGQNQPDIPLHSTPGASRAMVETSENIAPKVVPPGTIPSVERGKSSHSASSGTTDKVPSPSSDFRRTVYNTFMFSLKLVESLAEIFPVPGIKAAIGTLNVTIERFDKTNQNTRDLEALLDSFDSLNGVLRNLKGTSPLGRDMTKELQVQVNELSKRIQATKDTIEERRGHSGIRKFVDASDDAQFIIEQHRDLQESMTRIMTGTVLATEKRLVEQHAFEVLEKLPRAKAAQCDHVDLPGCSPGTRLDVLNKINHWVHDDDKHQIYWLTGGAGTGKTTVALTLAHSVNREEFLSASFFCSRASADRANARNIFPTLAYLLAQRNVHFRNELVQVIRQSPDIGHGLPPIQFKCLILQPMIAAGITTPVVFILDALDECADIHGPEKILSAIASDVPLLPYLKVFISSRPTTSTNDAFADEELCNRRAVFVLHDVEKNAVDADIKNYIIRRLKEKATKRKLIAPSWPPMDLVDKVVERAAGLFVYASTVCELIEHRGDLQYNLQQMANRPATGYTGIDGLYRQILETAIAEFRVDDHVQQCRSIVATIICLVNPMSLQDLGFLLGFTPDHIRGLLGDIQAVIIVPEDVHGTPYTLHASFPDFLMDKKRCLEQMYVHPATHRLEIVLQLLQHMQGLERDMCKIGNWRSNGQVQNLADVRRNHISGLLVYACHHWMNHLDLVSTELDDPELLHAVVSFISTKLLNWIEVLSLLGSLAIAVPNLQRAGSWLAKRSQSHQHLVELMDDLRTLLPEYYTAIEERASQIYCSLLAFTPPNMRLRQVYNHSDNPVMVTFSENTQGGRCMAYSADGITVAVGLENGIASFWDSETGLERKSWQANAQPLLAITFSPAGKLFASVSSDGVVKVWDVDSNELQKSLSISPDGQASAISEVSMAFSPDGTFLAVVTPISNKFWDTITWKETQRFYGRGSRIPKGSNCVAISPDNSRCAIADTNGIFITDRDGPLVHYNIRAEGIHRHLVFSIDNNLIRSTQGTFDVVKMQRVRWPRAMRKRFPAEVFLDEGWVVDDLGRRCCSVPEAFRYYDSYAAHENRIAFAGNGGLMFVKLLG